MDPSCAHEWEANDEAAVIWRKVTIENACLHHVLRHDDGIGYDGPPLVSA